ncbi:hypothetical protein PoB_006022900 [Plakobranchus ocellatus]|uniref:Chitin-binding type-2 domain-containing protein n=1 Tax=Plakobranchus ocellatus TaxID=259542 RepID=A0AAV4CPD1_9GAST|nr:hypothetical protein PoB_006022900 [Plakobranchus ocellatus]
MADSVIPQCQNDPFPLSSLIILQLVDIDCVNIRDAEPCKNHPVGKFHVCGLYALGYFAECKSNSYIIIKHCPYVKRPDGTNFRLVFHNAVKTCVQLEGN